MSKTKKKSSTSEPPTPAFYSANSNSPPPHSSFYCVIDEKKRNEQVKPFIVIYVREYELDQSQGEAFMLWNDPVSMSIYDGMAVAQSFTPQKGTLSRVSLWIGSVGIPTSILLLTIRRESPDGPVMAYKEMKPWVFWEGWYTWDFIDFSAKDISGEIVPHYLVMEVFPVPSAGGVGGYYTWYVDASCHRDPYPHGEFHIRTGNTWSTIPLINVAGAFRTYGYG